MTDIVLYQISSNCISVKLKGFQASLWTYLCRKRLLLLHYKLLSHKRSWKEHGFIGFWKSGIVFRFWRAFSRSWKLFCTENVLSLSGSGKSGIFPNCFHAPLLKSKKWICNRIYLLTKTNKQKTHRKIAVRQRDHRHSSILPCISQQIYESGLIQHVYFGYGYFLICSRRKCILSLKVCETLKEQNKYRHGGCWILHVFSSSGLWQGFHRYSTDQVWHVPHFEKMLYDQGQLAVSYIDAYQVLFFLPYNYVSISVFCVDVFFPVSVTVL